MPIVFGVRTYASRKEPDPDAYFAWLEIIINLRLYLRRHVTMYIHTWPNIFSFFIIFLFLQEYPYYIYRYTHTVDIESIRLNRDIRKKSKETVLVRKVCQCYDIRMTDKTSCIVLSVVRRVNHLLDISRWYQSC